LVEHAVNHNILHNNRITNIIAKRTAIENWVDKLEAGRGADGTFGDEIRRDATYTALPNEFMKQPVAVRDEVLYRIAYRGYLTRELKQVEKMRHLEKIKLPRDLDYHSVRGLRRESALKLAALRPTTLGQAGRISGVN